MYACINVYVCIYICLNVFVCRTSTISMHVRICVNYSLYGVVEVKVNEVFLAQVQDRHRHAEKHLEKRNKTNKK